MPHPYAPPHLLLPGREKWKSKNPRKSALKQNRQGKAALRGSRVPLTLLLPQP